MDTVLAHSLQAAGIPGAELVLDDGSELLVIPDGGRVLALFPPGGSQSLFWVNPALSDPSSACAFFAAGGWRSPGGHRLWLAPETHLFYPAFPDLSDYGVPTSIDPGGYVLDRSGGVARLIGRSAVWDYAAGSAVVVECTREFLPAARPECSSTVDVEYAGYTAGSTLRIVEGCCNGISLWSLIQLPQGGKFIVPVRPGAAPVPFLGEIPAHNLSVEEGTLRYAGSGLGIQKIGVHAAHSAGIALYSWADAGTASLVAVRFDVADPARYIDTPPDAPDSTGCVVQCCNVDIPELGAFAELEHLSPSIGGETGESFSEDVCQVWGFRGARKEIDSVAEALMAGAALCVGRA